MEKKLFQLIYFFLIIPIERFMEQYFEPFLDLIQASLVDKMINLFFKLLFKSLVLLANVFL